MSRSWRLELNLLLWFAAMPVIFIVAGAIEQGRNLSAMNYLMPVTLAVLSVWALILYRRYVSTAVEPWKRMALGIAFFAGMALLGLGAMWVSTVVMLAIYGA